MIIKPRSQEDKICLSALLESVLFHCNFKTWWQTAKFETTLPLFDKHFSLVLIEYHLHLRLTIQYYSLMDQKKENTSSVLISYSIANISRC